MVNNPSVGGLDPETLSKALSIRKTLQIGKIRNISRLKSGTLLYYIESELSELKVGLFVYLFDIYLTGVWGG